MSSANGTLGEIIKALDIAGVEMLALGLPENRIIDASRRLAQVWQCSKYEIVGHVLATNAGKVHARYVDTDATGANLRGGARIEVTLERIDRPDAVQRFRPHYLRDGSDEFLLLLAEAAAPADHEREETLARITEAAGYGPWELSAETGEVTLSATIAETLGVSAETAMPLADWQARIHPDDATADPVSVLASGGMPHTLSMVRLRDATNAWRLHEFITQVVRTAPGEPVARLIGLVRPAAEPAQSGDGADAGKADDRALAALGAARFTIDPATGSIDMPSGIITLLGLAAGDEGAAAALSELGERIEPVDHPAFAAALTEASQGGVPSPVVLRTDGGARCFRFSFIAGDGGAVQGFCQDVTGFTPVAPAAAAAAEGTPELAPVLRQVLDHLRTADDNDLRDAEDMVTLANAVESLRLRAAPEGPADDGVTPGTVGVSAQDDEAPASQPETIQPLAAQAEPERAAQSRKAKPRSRPELRPAVAAEPGDVTRDEAGAGEMPVAEAEPAAPLAPPLPPESLPDPAAAAGLAPPAFEHAFDVKVTAGPSAPRALVVDDDPSIRATIVAMLDDIGLPAIEASDGAEGLARLRRAPSVSLIVSDVVMEGVGGPEFLAEAFLERPDIRAILTSGYDLGVLLADVDLPDGIELMPKPFTRQEFLHKVETLLAPAAAA